MKLADLLLDGDRLRPTSARDPAEEWRDVRTAERMGRDAVVVQLVGGWAYSFFNPEVEPMADGSAVVPDRSNRPRSFVFAEANKER